MWVKGIVDDYFDNRGQSSVNIVDLFLKLRYNNIMNLMVRVAKKEVSIRERIMKQANVDKRRAKIAILLQLTMETADGQRY